MEGAGEEKDYLEDERRKRKRRKRSKRMRKREKREGWRRREEDRGEVGGSSEQTQIP